MKFFLLLSAVGLCWAQYNPHTWQGRTAIVHLFEWRWADIAAECERYLAPKGFGGVQVSPPNENIIINNPYRPWWERYQPISYKLCSRSGNEDEFRNMVTRCNNVGVRIYVDAVINHMCGEGNGAGTSSTCGSYYNSHNREFPAVPYSGWDFNDGKCKTGSGGIESYNDAAQVIDLGGEAIKSSEYFGNGRVTEFKYGAKLGTVIRKWNGEKMAYLRNWGEGWGFVPSDKALVFVDNHDNQRGHGAGGASILTFWDARLYKVAVGFMLAHPYGFARVMSSYRWDRNFQNGKDVNDWIGPPNNNGATKEVTINADTTCGNGWVCEHRWRQIRNMVAFRNVADGQPFTNWWENGSNQVAFGRGNKAFIVFNNDDWTLSQTLQTGLPAGTYCDVISGDKINGNCTGIKVQVSGDGKAYFSISNSAEDPFIAIHAESKL
ncbi:PREDICTED: pancreatic alpha-amylase isoform X3 [Chinchilla lanigera]|uniref:pancreatic alpha-amylase isoform X3 n=1 Tax=Chinchilla lanigera TaxID=34839 RepID=UPI00038ED13F|nr:PREDICTED: pancreatic alpha-amylase isoform X3 [Chinchilla lanigera]